MTPITLRVRELREARGWSQSELARRTGIAQSTLSKLETSQTSGVDFATLEKIAKALECPASYLIVESGK